MSKVLVGVTGSVASIKLPKLVAELKAIGAKEIAVVSTEHAAHFYSKDAAELVAAQVVWHTDADEWSSWNAVGDPVLHIELRNWADVFVIAPLDANTLAKLSTGMADNLLTCVARAWDFSKPIVVCPAMNTAMWDHPVTSSGLSTLQRWGYQQVAPISKRLACGDVGCGAMAEVQTIAAKVATLLPNRAAAAVSKSMLPPPPKPTAPVTSTTTAATAPLPTFVPEPVGVAAVHTAPPAATATFKKAAPPSSLPSTATSTAAATATATSHAASSSSSSSSSSSILRATRPTFKAAGAGRTMPTYSTSSGGGGGSGGAVAKKWPPVASAGSLSGGALGAAAAGKPAASTVASRYKAATSGGAGGGCVLPKPAPISAKPKLASKPSLSVKPLRVLSVNKALSGFSPPPPPSARAQSPKVGAGVSVGKPAAGVGSGLGPSARSVAAPAARAAPPLAAAQRSPPPRPTPAQVTVPAPAVPAPFGQAQRPSLPPPARPRGGGDTDDDDDDDDDWGDDDDGEAGDGGGGGSAAAAASAPAPQPARTQAPAPPMPVAAPRRPSAAGMLPPPRRPSLPRAAAPPRSAPAAPAASAAPGLTEAQQAFVDMIRAEYGGLSDISTEQVNDMCTKRLAPRPDWFLDSSTWLLSPGLYSVPKESSDASLAQMLKDLGPAADVELGVDATAARLEDMTFSFSFS